MRLFESRDLVPALLWAAAGGQALHLHRHGIGRRSPAPFARAVAAGEHIAHLFDWNTARLERTVRTCYVRRVYVHEADRPTQHVDLCGQALMRAKRYCWAAGDAWTLTLGLHWLSAAGRRPEPMTPAAVRAAGVRLDGRPGSGKVWRWVAAAGADDRPHAIPPGLVLPLGLAVGWVGTRIGVTRVGETATAVYYPSLADATAAVTAALGWVAPAVLRDTAGLYDDRGAAAGLSMTADEFEGRARRRFMLTGDRAFAWVRRYTEDQGAAVAGGVPATAAP